MAPPTISTTARLLLLLSLLQARRDWPGQVLAERLDVSHRTVRRDVDRLREMGYSIQATKGPGAGYRLQAGADLPPLLFDDDQVIALAVALQTASWAGAGLEEAAERALAAIRLVMPSRLRHRLDALRFTALPGRASTEPARPDVLVDLSAAVRAREVLRLDYTSRLPDGDDDGGDGGTTTVRRRVEPHHLVASQGRWYLVAWDLDVGDWRLLRADRVSPRTPAGPRFTPREVPGVSVAAFVAARFKGSAQEDRWPCRGSVVLALGADAVLPFAGDAVVASLGPGRCRLEAGSWSWVALAASLGRFDADIVEAAPAELAGAFGLLADRFATAAGRSPKPTDPGAGRGIEL